MTMEGWGGCSEHEYDALAADDEHLDDNKAAISWNGSFGAVSLEAEITRLRDTLKTAREALRGMIDLTPDYNLDSEQAGRAYAALKAIDAALEQSR